MTNQGKPKPPVQDNMFNISAAHLAKIDLVASSRFFSESWYATTYPDVMSSGLSPAEHYVRIGSILGRDPSPGFSTRYYLRKHKDVRRAGVNPVVHYETRGRAEGRSIAPAWAENQDADDALFASLIDRRRPSVPDHEAHRDLDEVFASVLEGEPTRLRPSFDTRLAQRFIDCLVSLPGGEAKVATIKATVVMPTFNRADKIECAIQSVLDQSHKNLELIIVDDGSTDETPRVLERFRDEPRVRVFWNAHAGVSAARNTALLNGVGEVVFYLDTDNAWTRDYVKLMLLALQASGRDCAYAASCIKEASGKLVGYRAETFNWSRCLERNYVDMNVFCHRRSVTEELGTFDTGLRRVVDWDLILRYTKSRGAVFCPVVGCLYTTNASDASRISVSQPYAYRKIVQVKNFNDHKSAEEALAHVQYTIALKIAAPYEERAAWGDYHYAQSLAAALAEIGHKVRIDFRGDWYKMPENTDDIVIVLRGRVAYKPRSTDINLLWNISHPDQISYEEYCSYNGIFVASGSYAALLAFILDRDVEALLQCTDSNRFKLSARPGSSGRGVFVGNSRSQYREIVKWAVDAELPFDLYGNRWDKFLPGSVIKGENVDNEQLGAVYASADFVLNDHWASMREFGFVSNRVFDVLGCGGRLISDHVPALAAMFGDGVICVKDEADFKARMADGLPALPAQRRGELSAMVHAQHSFKQRAETLLDWVRTFLLASSRSSRPRRVASAGQPRRRIGILLPEGSGLLSRSVVTRLIAPLTTDEAHVSFEVASFGDVEDEQVPTLDGCIVQEALTPSLSDARRLVARLKERNCPLFVDADDSSSFGGAQDEHDKAVRYLMAEARETWFSTPTLAARHGGEAAKVRVVRDVLDPRLWRNYRQPVRTSFSDGPVRFMCLGVEAGREGLDLLLPALDRLAESFPGRFEVTLVEPAHEPPVRPWLRSINVVASPFGHPGFVRWLAGQADHDVGLCPLPDSAANRAKSDTAFLHQSALGLLSLVSDGPAYADILAQGLAIGCADTTDAWYEAMAQVIQAPDSVLGMRQRAADEVWARRSTIAGANPLLDALDEVILPVLPATFALLGSGNVPVNA